ncbi:hypothetical protein BCR37DRAFT_380606 [Protomyces lactucae-debilis]|uniref:Uncharacterized protein n=1 Tax=Protomyces lactucae-debilis TaxID=2754530 RepID=A0A1Y2FAD2_PROLT|nr:uncharacterized protein BCR37DRAFT_380606 [Protomyces lactucae-debilis]ORY80833.1 hypothetical protein BCR37DRAFT_380606 [Protomyces lactucae-debilis]
MTALKSEMRDYRVQEAQKSEAEKGLMTSVCDLQRFPAIMSYELFSRETTLKGVRTKNSETAEKEKRSWPLFGWHSMPDEAIRLGNPFSCPEKQAKEAEKELPLERKRAARPSRVIKDICLCPNNHDDDGAQCSRTEWICETISLARAIDNLRRGRGDLFDVYVEKFPQLKDYVEPISGTAIANDQVSQQNWATLLTAVGSGSRKGLNFDLNLPAADEGDEL